jgi:hypothetical protein
MEGKTVSEFISIKYDEYKQHHTTHTQALWLFEPGMIYRVTGHDDDVTYVEEWNPVTKTFNVCGGDVDDCFILDRWTTDEYDQAIADFEAKRRARFSDGMS